MSLVIKVDKIPKKDDLRPIIDIGNSIEALIATGSDCVLMCKNIDVIRGMSTGEKVADNVYLCTIQISGITFRNVPVELVDNFGFYDRGDYAAVIGAAFLGQINEMYRMGDAIEFHIRSSVPDDCKEIDFSEL